MHRIGRAVLEVMGIDPARSTVNYWIVRQWLADGADEALILEVVRSKMRAGVEQPGYFTKAIRDALARRPVEVVDAAPSARFAAWEAAMAGYRADGRRGEVPMLDWFAADGSRVGAAVAA